MENDELNRDDPPEPWTAPEPDEPPGPAADDRLNEAEPEPAVSASEIESWPSQDLHAAQTETETTPPWPTEPPAAGSADADAWPTQPPLAGTSAEPIAYADEAPLPPPSEIEAYPASNDEPADAAHAVPPSGNLTTESTLCPRCGTENQAGLSFCRSCGQRLMAAGVAATVTRPSVAEGTMACPRCGTHNRAGVAFCQNCGANLRAAAPGYVPPAATEAAQAASAARGGAVLGPVVLLIGIVGLVTGYLLPFAFGSDSLFERAFGAGGYGIGFWTAYPTGGLANQIHFGLAAGVPILALLLAALAVAGFLRARPQTIQVIGLAIALLWSVGLIVLFGVVEVAGNWNGDLVGMLRALTPAGIIFLLTSLIIVIGTLTRFGRS